MKRFHPETHFHGYENQQTLYPVQPIQIKKEPIFENMYSPYPFHQIQPSLPFVFQPSLQLQQQHYFYHQPHYLPAEDLHPHYVPKSLPQYYQWMMYRQMTQSIQRKLPKHSIERLEDPRLTYYNPNQQQPADQSSSRTEPNRAIYQAIFPDPSEGSVHQTGESIFDEHDLDFDIDAALEAFFPSCVSPSKPSEPEEDAIPESLVDDWCGLWETYFPGQ